MIKSIFSFLFLFNILICAAQVSERIENILIENEKYIDYSSIHPISIELEETIDKEATTDELYHLCLNGDINRRMFAIKALVRRGDDKIIDVFDKALQSGEHYKNERYAETISLADFIYGQVYHYTKFHDSSPDLYIQILEDMFDNIIKHYPDDIKLLESLAYYIPLQEKYYNYVRERVIKFRSDKLLVHIAKYQKEQDIELILSFDKDALGAIEKFPHDAFLQILEANFEQNEKYPYMFALGKYCNERAYGIAKKVIDYNVSKLDAECGNFCLDFLYDKIEEPKCKLFYPLLEELWITYKIISFNVYNNYKLTHLNDETADFLLKGFLTEEEPFIIQNNVFDIEDLLHEEWATKEDKIALLLIELKHLSKEKYAEALRHNLKHIWGGGLEDFLVSLDDTEVLNYISDILRNRFNYPDDITEMLYITDVARRFKDDELYKYGLKNIRQKRNDFKKYDYLEEEYQDFLKRHKIK